MGELRRRLANAHDIDRPDVVREWAERHGGVLDGTDLQELADGPIISPLRIYLPQGRCSEAAVLRRNRVS